jgi:hypothetical protein
MATKDICRQLSAEIPQNNLDIQCFVDRIKTWPCGRSMDFTKKYTISGTPTRHFLMPSGIGCLLLPIEHKGDFIHDKM